MAANKMPKRMNLGDIGNYGTTDHGKDGSHQDSHKKLGGFRERIHTGDPEELDNPNDGRTE